MKKKYAYILWSIIGLLLVAFFLIQDEHQKTLDGSICSLEKMGKIESKIEWVPREETGDLMFKDTPVPYDGEYDLYYFPLNTELEWRDYIFLPEFGQMNIYWYEDEYWNDMETAIRESHVFHFLITDGNRGTKCNIVFTGLPMAFIRDVQQIDMITFAKFTLFDPFFTADGDYQILKTFMHYEHRGKTSRLFPKMGLNIELCNLDKEKEKHSLLGMREDDDWKLNALYSDESKIREKTCLELWNEIARLTPEPYDQGSRMEYLEVIMNWEYQGVYGLQEPIDYKQTSLDKEKDILYKTVLQPYEKKEENDGSDMDGVPSYYGIEIKTFHRWPTDELWNPAMAYVEDFGILDDEVHKPIFEFTKADKYIKNHFNMDNFLSFELFIQMIYGKDNLYKNQYWAVERENSEEYCMWKIPWDLNYSFGDVYSLANDKFTVFDENSSRDILRYSLITEEFVKIDHMEYAQLVNEKWQELRTCIFSEENIKGHFNSNYMELLNSGAYLRDSANWSDEEKIPDITYIMTWIDNKLDFLDSYYESLVEGQLN